MWVTQADDRRVTALVFVICRDEAKLSAWNVGLRAASGAPVWDPTSERTEYLFARFRRGGEVHRPWSPFRWRTTTSVHSGLGVEEAAGRGQVESQRIVFWMAALRVEICLDCSIARSV